MEWVGDNNEAGVPAWRIHYEQKGPNTANTVIQSPLYTRGVRAFVLEWDPIDLHQRTWHVVVEETINGLELDAVYDIVFRTFPRGLGGNRGVVGHAKLAWQAFLNVYVAGRLPIHVNGLR